MTRVSVVFLWLVLAAIVFESTGTARAQTTASAAYAGNAENGKRLFTANGCYECHNYNGSGGRHGPRLSQNKLTAAAFIAFVRRPRTMPAYSTKVMSDQETTDIWAFIKTLPAPPPLSSIPLLNVD